MLRLPPDKAKLVPGLSIGDEVMMCITPLVAFGP
jgi:hypothetical protein